MRKVTIVVPVLMTSCQVSLKWKIGPLMIQAPTTLAARPKHSGWPVKRAARLASLLKAPWLISVSVDGRCGVFQVWAQRLHGACA